MIAAATSFVFVELPAPPMFALALAPSMTTAGYRSRINPSPIRPEFGQPSTTSARHNQKTKRKNPTHSGLYTGGTQSHALSHDGESGQAFQWPPQPFNFRSVAFFSPTVMNRVQ